MTSALRNEQTGLTLAIVQARVDKIPISICCNHVLPGSHFIIALRTIFYPNLISRYRIRIIYLDQILSFKNLPTRIGPILIRRHLSDHSKKLVVGQDLCESYTEKTDTLL